MTQFRHPRYNPDGDHFAENCGPASLAMAARFLGSSIPAIPGWDEPTAPQAWIDATRFWMFSDRNGRSLNDAKDGVRQGPCGFVRAPQEHQTLVNLPDLELGASNLGLAASRIWSWADFEACGSPVLLAGDPSVSGAYGPRLGIDYQGGHIILVHPDSKGFRVNDPLCGTGPIRLEASELKAFCQAAPLGEVLGLALTI